MGYVMKPGKLCARRIVFGNYYSYGKQKSFQCYILVS